MRAYSDKYTVLKPYQYAASRTAPYGASYDAHSRHVRPPLIIFGMKPRLVLIVSAIIVCILIASSVGGAVGGRNLRDAPRMNSVSSNTTLSESTMSGTTTGTKTTRTTSTAGTTAESATPTALVTYLTTSTQAAPSTVATQTPSSDCPSSDDTTYTSPQSDASNITFIKYCNLSNPLTVLGFSGAIYTQAYVYTFDDCIEMCIGYNQWAGDAACQIAVYQATALRPANCWIGKTVVNSTAFTALASSRGTDVAVLARSS